MAIKGSSDELQSLVLSSMIKFPDTCGRYHKYITEQSFADSSYKVVFRAIKTYYGKYMTSPSENELSVLIDNIRTEQDADIEIIKSCISELYQQRISSEDFCEDTIRDFITRNNFEATFRAAYDYMESYGEINTDIIRSRLISDVSLDLIKSPAMNLADLSTIKPAMEEALGSDDNPVKVKLFIDGINKCMQYGALTPGTLNLVTAPPGRGKTTFLINQGVCAAQNELKTLHIFLGDMSKHDARLRYLSCLTGVDTRVLVGLTDVELGKFTQKWNTSGYLSNIYIAAYPAEYLTVQQLIEEIVGMQKTNNVHFHQIIIDYDENIAPSNPDNMYESGGDTYNYIYKFAGTNKSVIFIASQPKPLYWGNEIIPMEAASESSKKQKIIDMMITLGAPSKQSTIGTLYIAKNRRGETDRVFRVKKTGSNARIEHISEDEYQQIKSEESRNEEPSRGNNRRN